MGQNLWGRGNATKNNGRVKRARTGVEKTEETMIVVMMIGHVTTFI